MIKFNNQLSEKFGLRVLNEMEYTSPEYDYSLIELSGVDGDLAIDNHRFKGTDISFPVTIRSDHRVETSARKISSWLKSRQGWSDLEWSGDPGYVYNALYVEQIDVQRKLETYGAAVLTFRLKPFKYLKSGLRTIDITTSKVLKNPEAFESKPVIKIYGTGSIDLKINDSAYSLKGMNGYLIIDCEYQFCEDSGGNANEKAAFYPYPQLKTGDNTFSWSGSGTVTKVEVTPRWRCLV